MKLALVIGRFQPLHWGHVELIEAAQKAADQTLIIAGSSNVLPDFKNPFPVEQRIELLNTILVGDDYIIQTQKDRPTDDEWIQDIIARVNNIEEDPSKVVLFCAEKDEEWYKNNFIYEVRTVSNREISATDVRHAWYHGSLWTVEDDIPEATKRFLEEHPDYIRLHSEYHDTTLSKDKKTEGHPFNNPIEPVSFAVIVHNGKVLTGVRGGTRGHGQRGLPGGFIEKDETTLDAAIRETKEEMGLDLKELAAQGKAVCMAQAVEENIDDLGVRTIGINYLFVLKPDEEFSIKVDGTETLDYEWVSCTDIVEDNELLFYNHNLVVKRLLSKLGDNK